MAVRFLTFVAAVLLLAGCGGTRRLPAVSGFEILETEWPMPSAEDARWPSGMTVRLTVDNPGGAVVLRGGRLRVMCGGGRAAVLVLGERVRIPGHGQWRVRVPVRLRIARNASALSLRSAIARRDAAAVSVDWELSLRRGAWRGSVDADLETLDGMLSGEELQHLWQVLDRVSGASGEGAAAPEQPRRGAEPQDRNGASATNVRSWE